MKLNAEISTPNLVVSLDDSIKFFEYLKQNNLENTIRTRVEYFCDENETNFTLNFSRIQECTNGDELPTFDQINLLYNEISNEYDHNCDTGEVECKNREEFILFAEKLNEYYNNAFKNYYPQDKSLVTWHTDIIKK